MIYVFCCCCCCCCCRHRVFDTRQLEVTNVEVYGRGKKAKVTAIIDETCMVIGEDGEVQGSYQEQYNMLYTLVKGKEGQWKFTNSEKAP